MQYTPGTMETDLLNEAKTRELYNLVSDISEQHDLASLYPDRTTRLAGLLSNELKKEKKLKCLPGKVLVKQ